MSKRRRDFWNDETLEFQNSSAHPPNPNLKANLSETENSPNEAIYLEEAHEALSKLFNKTNKRAKQMRGVRRKDAWQ